MLIWYSLIFMRARSPTMIFFCRGGKKRSRQKRDLRSDHASEHGRSWRRLWQSDRTLSRSRSMFSIAFCTKPAQNVPLPKYICFARTHTPNWLSYAAFFAASQCVDAWHFGSRINEREATERKIFVIWRILIGNFIHEKPPRSKFSRSIDGRFM